MAIIDISSSADPIWVIGGTIPTTRTITAATWASGGGGLATYTTSVNHGYSVNHVVTVSGISPSGYNVTAGTITAVPTASTFKLAVTSNPGAYVSGGTATPNCIDGGIDLHDGANTFLLDGTTLGEPNRGETWIQPKVPGAAAVLSQTWDEPAIMTLVLRLKYASVAACLTNGEAIRTAFSAANTFWHSYKGQTNLRSFTTYRSPVPPFTEDSALARYLLASNGEVPRWVLSVRRYPWADGTSALAL